ncbi:MAG: glycosyltransferase family 39 protein [Chloroflexota bacterium]|nr:glycosyltransferase family 39 protein [Chloroflexota bacterium]MDQ5864759.1 glycosyltransferase family 39 protein [Chloroflexota bacterium]
MASSTINTLKPAANTTRATRAAWTPSLLALAGLVLVAAGLRFYCLDCYGLWYDEVSSVQVAQRGLGAVLTDRFGWMRVQTPLHYLLVWLSIQPLDPTASAVLVRLPSVLAGLLTPAVAYGLGREMFGRAQGLLAALFVALSAVHVSHSQDARPYVFLALFTGLSIYCLLVSERTGERRWWLAFAGSMAANLLMTYHALTLAVPAFAPYLLWVLYRAWRGRHVEHGRAQLRSAILSVVIIAAVGVVVLLDILGVPRTPPNLSQFSLASVGDQLGRMLNRLGQVGVEREAEKTLQWVVAAVALLGVLFGIRQRRYRAVLLCLLMLLVPVLLMAVLRTTNTVFQRYVLFTMPFYFLLLANAVVGARTLLPANWKAAGRAASGALGAGLLMLFGLGLYVYFSPEQHKQLSFLPDYRGAARYLSERAQPGDLIVLLEEPPQSMQVFDFYWHGSPPAPSMAAIDPRVHAQPAPRSIYWVVTYALNDPAYLEALRNASPRAQFASVGEFHRLLVLQENSPGEVTPSLQRMAARMSQANPPFSPSLQSLHTLQGSLLQASGDTEAAANVYRTAGPFYLIGEEYLTTARGFHARGDRRAAWREAIMSLFVEPYRPQTHTFLAQLLQEEGLTPQSDLEQQVAEQLGR